MKKVKAAVKAAVKVAVNTAAKVTRGSKVVQPSTRVTRSSKSSNDSVAKDSVVQDSVAVSKKKKSKVNKSSSSSITSTQILRIDRIKMRFKPNQIRRVTSKYKIRDIMLSKKLGFRNETFLKLWMTGKGKIPKDDEQNLKKLKTVLDIF